MIFFVGNDGTVIKSVPSPVYQGSADSNNIYLVAPFAENLEVSVAFKLPNGVIKSRYPMTPLNEIKGVINEQTGKPYSGWSLSIPNDITQYFGTVTAQFFFYAAESGVITATSSTSFVVAQGVPSILPPKPSDDIYDIISKNISELREQINNGDVAARSVYAWNATYTYGAGELVFYPAKGTYGVFLKSLVSNNKSAPYVNGVLDTDNWLLVSDFNILTELYTLKEDTEQLEQNAKLYSESAEESAEMAQNGADMAQNAAASVQAEADYLNGIKDGSVAVPKATADGTGQNIANRFTAVNSDIQELKSGTGFTGAVSAPTITGENGVYDGDKRVYSLNNPPPTGTLPSDALPLMDGEASVGNANAYARGDHRHPSDDTKADKTGTYLGMTVGTANYAALAQSADDAGQLRVAYAIDGVPFDGTENINHYATCATSSSMVAKTVTKAGFVLAGGARITVSFSYANNVSSPTLNVNSTGAKPIKADGDTVYVKWLAGALMTFVYDGTNWVIVEGYALKGMRVSFIYQSANSTSPATLYGGSWTEIAGRFLLARSTTHAAGSTGGETTHTHGIGTLYGKLEIFGAGYVRVKEKTVEDYTPSYQLHAGTGSSFSSTNNGTGLDMGGAMESASNMPPYLAVYMWKRTA